MVYLPPLPCGDIETNSTKLRTLENKSVNIHYTKLLTTNIPTLNPSQTKLTILIVARPIGLAHTKEKDINQHKKIKPRPPNTIKNKYPNLSALLTTNSHNIKHNHRNIKTTHIPKNKNLHTHHIHCNRNTPPPTRIKIHINKKLKTIHKNHMVYLPLPQRGDIKTNPSPAPNTPTKHPPAHKHKNKTYSLAYTSKTPSIYHHLIEKCSPTLKPTQLKHEETTITHPHLSTYIFIHQHHPLTITQ